MFDKLIDISIPIDPNGTTWPKTPKVRIHRESDKAKGDFATSHRIDMDLHSGTHIDAPLHHIIKGRTTEEISLEKMIGTCRVIEFLEAQIITEEMLESKNIIKNDRRVLFKTNNSNILDYHSQKFDQNYCALSFDASKYLALIGIDLVGIDYFSIQKYNDGPEPHEILLEKDVVILEGLNLSLVSEGYYELICLPIKINGVEAAPCRAILRKD